MYYYRNKAILGQYSQAGLQSIKQTLLINLFYSFNGRNIDNMGHILGFLGTSKPPHYHFFFYIIIIFFYRWWIFVLSAWAQSEAAGSWLWLETSR